MTSPVPSSAFRHPLAMILDARRGSGGSLAGHDEDLALASDPMAKSDDLDNLARKTIEGIGDGWSWLETDGEEWSILTAIAKNPSISKKTTKLLLWVGEESDTLNRPIAEALGQNPSRFIGRLEDPVFSEDVDRYVSFFTTDTDSLRELAFHQSSLVREGVANNLNTPADLVEMLARDPDPEVRYHASREASPSREGSLAGHKDDLEEAADPTTPDDRLRALIFKAYTDWTVDKKDPRPLFLAIAANASASATTLDELISYADSHHGDIDREVLRLIEKNPGRLLGRLDMSVEQYALDLAIAARTSNVDTLRELAMSRDEEVRKAVAFNTDTPSDLMEALARDPSEDVVRSVAMWAPRLSLATQIKLAEHEDYLMRHHLLKTTIEGDVISRLIETEPEYRDEGFWSTLKEHPSVTTKHLKAWVKRYNDETGEELTLEEFEEWER